MKEHGIIKEIADLGRSSIDDENKCQMPEYSHCQNILIAKIFSCQMPGEPQEWLKTSQRGLSKRAGKIFSFITSIIIIAIVTIVVVVVILLFLILINFRQLAAYARERARKTKTRYDMIKEPGHL